MPTHGQKGGGHGGGHHGGGRSHGYGSLFPMVYAAGKEASTFRHKRRSQVTAATPLSICLGQREFVVGQRYQLCITDPNNPKHEYNGPVTIANNPHVLGHPDKLWVITQSGTKINIKPNKLGEPISQPQGDVFQGLAP